MAGTMEGLGVPLFGGYTANASDGTTSYLTVNASGTHDFTWTDKGADNFISVTIADGTTVSSGYCQAYYANVTFTGSHTAQTNVFASDITYGGTISGEHSGMYLYFAETGTVVFNTDNTQIKGVTVYFSAFGDQAINRAGFHVYSSETGTFTGANVDAALWATCAGTSGTFGSLLAVTGSTPPEYFLDCASNVPWAATSRMLRVLASDNSAIVAQLRVMVFETEYFIPLYATTCS